MKKKEIVEKSVKRDVVTESVLALQEHLLQVFARFPQSEETLSIIECIKKEKEKLSK